MIIVQITSGLGNQLFQYAAARRLAYIHNTPLKFDLSWFEINSFRKFGLSPFNIGEAIATGEEIEYTRQLNHINEQFFHFNPDLLNAGPPAYLSGYWQSEKYFKDIEAVIRSEFIIKYPLNSINFEMAAAINRCNAVSLHIRRNDYLIDRNHGVCSWDYYREAIKFVADRVHNPCFFVFSDDWNWIRESLHLNYPFTLVTVNDDVDAYWDLYLMSLCKHHIIANSTFSWWGAWLASNPQQIVVAPSKWFQDLQYSIEDLIPSVWQVI